MATDHFAQHCHCTDYHKAWKSTQEKRERHRQREEGKRRQGKDKRVVPRSLNSIRSTLTQHVIFYVSVAQCVIESSEHVDASIFSFSPYCKRNWWEGHGPWFWRAARQCKSVLWNFQSGLLLSPSSTCSWLKLNCILCLKHKGPLTETQLMSSFWWIDFCKSSWSTMLYIPYRISVCVEWFTYSAAANSNHARFIQVMPVDDLCSLSCSVTSRTWKYHLSTPLSTTTTEKPSHSPLSHFSTQICSASTWPMQ